MSSSGGALTRSRSLRKPTITSRPDAESTASALPSPADDSNGDGQLRNVSPSRLPVKGMGAVSSRPPPTRTAAAVGVAARSNTSRPLSGVFGRMTASSTRSRAPENETPPSSGPDTAAAAAAAAAATTTTTSRPPRTTRPVPTQRPTSSSGVPAASATRTRVASSHSRTKSTSTSISTSTSTSVTSLTGATTLRPPSATSHVSAPLATAGTDRSRPPLTSNTRASGTLHRRQVSATSNSSYASSTTTATSASAATTATTGALSDHRANTSAAAAASSSSSSSSSNPTARPAFTTLQQHYSPAKSLAPKPLTASFLAPPSPSKLPANVAASAETSRLQTELLQLHLLHRSAGPVAAQWRASARHKLAARFDRLVRAADDVARLDAGAAERRNVRALLAWQGHGHGHAAADFPPSLLGVGAASAENTGATLLEHKVQTLDAVLTGLWAVAEPGGRYARAVRRFERWAERVDALAELRRALASNSENHPAAAAAAAAVVASTGDDNGSGGGEDELSVLAGELDAAWKDECAGLVRRLDEWHRMLRGELAGHDDDGLLSTAEQEGDEGNDESGGEGSSLHRILTACRVLVADMLAELHAMDRIERDAVAAENAWVRAMNRDGEDDSPPAPARAGALWRVL